MSFTAIHVSIKEKLNTLLPATIKEIYGYKINPMEHEFAGYPVAELVESGNETDYLSTKENIRVYAYEIYIYQDVEGAGGMDEAYVTLRSLVDTIINLFDNNESLVGADGWVEPSFAGFGDFARRNKKIAVAVITLRCHKAIPLS